MSVSDRKDIPLKKVQGPKCLGTVPENWNFGLEVPFPRSGSRQQIIEFLLQPPVKYALQRFSVQRTIGSRASSGKKDLQARCVNQLKLYDQG